MIKKVVEISKNGTSDDKVELSWFDMQKPNLSAVTQYDVNFIIKTKFTHLHEKDILVCEDGYHIEVIRSEDEIYILEFSDHLTFAKAAYEIGNRHQPICIEENKITVLDDIALADIITMLSKDASVKVTQTKGYFRPNGKAHHAH